MEFKELDKDLSYLYGWFAGDGNLYNTTRNRGRLSTEIKYEDRDIIEKLKVILDSMGINSFISTRIRNTNFKSNYKSVSLKINSFDFRRAIMKAGFPEGKKNFILTPPLVPFIKTSFARGLIDSDGLFCIGKNMTFRLFQFA